MRELHGNLNLTVIRAMRTPRMSHSRPRTRSQPRTNA